MNNNQKDNFPVFDPFAAAPQGGGQIMADAANPATTTPQQQQQEQPKALSQIQFRSSLQVKQEAKIQAEKQKEEALLASLQAVDLTTTPAFGQEQQQQSSSSSSLSFVNENNNDPFAHLANMPLKQMSSISSQSKSKGKKDDEDDDDDEKIPIPDDPVLYQAQQAALYAEEILKQEAAARQKHSQQGLNEFWNKAQGLFKTATTTSTTSQTNSGQDGGKTHLNQKQSAKQEPQHSATVPQTPSINATFSSSASSVPTTPQAYPLPYNYNNNNNIPAMNATAVAVPHNTAHAAAPYVTATAPTVVPVPRPTTTTSHHSQQHHASPATITTMPAAAAANNNNDQSHIPWYARKHPQEQQANNDDNDSSRVPWYSRAPPPSHQQSTYSVSVADQEYQDPNANNNNNKAPWYGERGGGCEQSASSSSSSSSSQKKGMGSVMGASALGGVVGLVALGPLAGVAAAGGLAYAAATKQGAVGEVARGAGNLVAAAVNATRGTAKKEREPSSYRPNNSSSGPLI